MIEIIWEYTVKRDRAAEFERYYSSSGTWATLFRRSPAYRETLLLRDAENRSRYVTVDRWDDVESFQALRQKFSSEYEQMDRTCEEFTESERCLGMFEIVQASS